MPRVYKSEPSYIQLSSGSVASTPDYWVQPVTERFDA